MTVFQTLLGYWVIPIIARLFHSHELLLNRVHTGNLGDFMITVREVFQLKRMVDRTRYKIQSASKEGLPVFIPQYLTFKYNLGALFKKIICFCD